MPDFADLPRDRLEETANFWYGLANDLTAENLNLRTATELLIECDYCHAPVEYRCRTATGARAQYTHRPRAQWARNVAAGTQSPLYAGD